MRSDQVVLAKQLSQIPGADAPTLGEISGLTVSNNKILEIYTELKQLQLKKFPNAIAVLLRVFIENSVDHYMENHKLALKFKSKEGSREIYKSLRQKLEEVVDHMVREGAERKDFNGITRALSDTNHPLSIDLQHAYVHNRYVTPSERDLVVAWDNAERFFRQIWQ